ncbi:MAG: hypothetical protein GYB36_13270 [Alphaproteobacteria bacterium]|nr:hypothetical protein [Alphaproteobacteria bacterium]
MKAASIHVLLLSALGALALTSPAMAQDDDLEGFVRTGSIYHRLDMSQGTPAICEAVCARDQQCQSWSWAQAGLMGPDAQCQLLSSAPTPQRRPGHVTGLAPQLRERIDQASERALSAREQAALAATEHRPYP